MLGGCAVDLVAELAGHRESSHRGAQQPEVEGRAAHEGQGVVADVLVGELRQQVAGSRPGECEAHRRVGDVAHRDFVLRAFGDAIQEPAHVPLAQVIRAHEPPGAVAPVEQREVALEPSVGCQHHGEPRASRRRQARGHDAVEPVAGIRAGHLEAREAGGVHHAHRLAHCAAFLGNDGEGVGAFQRRRFLEAGRSEEQRRLEPPGASPLAPGSAHAFVGRRFSERPTGGQLLVRIRHHEAA